MKKKVCGILLAAALTVAALALPGFGDEQAATTREAADLIDQWRQEARVLVLEQMELSWRRRTTGEQVDIAATYEGHESMFSPQTAAVIARAATVQSDPAKRRALEFFRVYLLGEMVSMRVAELDDKIQSYLAKAEFSYADKSYTYYDYHGLIQNEADYGKRQEISDAVVPIIDKANGLLRTKEERVQRLARELGFADYNALSEQLRHVNLSEFAVVCRQFLDRTDREFASLLRWASPFQLGYPVEKLRRCDLGRLFKNLRYDKYFGLDDMMPRMKRFLHGMGLSMDKIKVDDADRPQKNPRAACYPMVVPDDVRLTIKPAGGPRDYQVLWHEMGHAQHFANTTTPVWEFQQLGDYVTTESYAFLFDGMFENETFCRDVLGMKSLDLRWHVRYTSFLKLYMVRRYCAKVLYEIELHRGADDPAGLYRELLGRAYGLPLDENDGKRYLLDTDDFFYSADYTRAWLLEAMLDRKLTEKYGEKWFDSKAAGEFLRGLWQVGNYYTGDELAQKIGFTGIDPGVLVERIHRRVTAE